MFAISSISKRLLEKLQRKAYRHAYLAEHVRRGIAYQIRALRDARKWKQGEFAKRLGKYQSVVCRLEDPGYGKVTIQTLLEVANVFDVALEVRFVSYSAFIANTRDVSVPSMRVSGFEDDLGLSASKISPIKVFAGFSAGPFIDAGWLSDNHKESASMPFIGASNQPPGGTIVLH